MRDKQTGELVAVKFIERGEKVGNATSLEPLHLETAGIPPWRAFSLRRSD